MTSILKKIRRSLVNAGSTRRYLLYAIGEIALVVIGILIALQINNWNEERKVRAKEIEILKGFQQTLTADLEKIRSNHAYNKMAKKSIYVLLDHLENDLPYHDSLNYHFSLSTYVFWDNLNASIFETLKSEGLNLISNKNLRDTLAQVYGILNNSTHNSGDRYMDYILDASKNIFSTRFLGLWDTRPDKIQESKMIPIDYEKLKKDDEYLYLLRSLPNMQFYLLDDYALQLIGIAERLLFLIEGELEKME